MNSFAKVIFFYENKDIFGNQSKKMVSQKIQQIR